MWLRPVLAVAALLSSASAAAAPTSADDRALAEALFREGKALLEAGDTQAACKKLEESRHLENAGGTVLALAICYEYDGRNASAWAEFQVALELARRAGREDRIRLASERIEALEKTLHWVSLRVSEANRALPEFRVERNGNPVPPASWGTRVALDPGKHVFEASAPDHLTWTGAVTVTGQPGETSLEVPRLERLATPDTAVVPVANPREPDRTARREEPRAHHGTERAVGYALAGVGAGALVTAGYFSLRSIAARSRVAGGCVENQCAAEFEDDYAAAGSWDRAALATASAGLVAGTVGAYLLVQHAPRDREQSWGTRDWVGLSLASAGVGSLVLGGLLAAQGVSDSNRVWAECEIGPCNDADLETFDRAIERQTAGIVLVSIGAVSAATGVYLLSTPSEKSSKQAGGTFRPWVRASLGALWFGGSL